MRGKILQRVRLLHTWLGVFFSPLLLLFIITGWWQTFAPDDEDARTKGAFNAVMSKFSNIHTDDFFSGTGAHHASGTFKILVAAMAISLIVTILLGLALACQTMKKTWWFALAFLLGILVPALALCFS